MESSGNYDENTLTIASVISASPPVDGEYRRRLIEYAAYLRTVLEFAQGRLQVHTTVDRDGDRDMLCLWHIRNAIKSLEV
jgi:hypothetical protein